jgi:p-hydroxybenzoate 3-monooxygenase
MRTQVGIIGAGPAGLTLARLLQQRGIKSVIVEARSRKHVEERARAGVLEQGTVDLFKEMGVAGRMSQFGLVHHDIEIRFNGQGHRIDMHELTGRSITIYGQHEIVRDLIQLRLETGADMLFEAGNVRIDDLQNPTPRICFQREEQDCEIVCDFIAGCDGFHGICRPSIPPGVLTFYARTYPPAWLGILAEAAPPSAELIYAHNNRGFALASMRSPQVSRFYLQCAPDENIDNWPDDRIWEELRIRLAARNSSLTLEEGPVFQKSITGMHSFVTEPMQYGNIADTLFLANALTEFYRLGRRCLLDRYSQTCLRRIWRIQRFSWWMTSILHRLDDRNDFDYRRQIAELDYLTSSRAAAASFAENYVGLPLN